MKTAVLIYTTKHGTETYVAQVPDLALEDAIIKAMVKEFRVDYEKSTPEQDAMGEGETLTLNLYAEVDVPELDVKCTGVPSISQGEWRFSENGEEVTTSRRGILEGSKKVCELGTFDKSRAEIKANGRAISAVPEMMAALRQIVTAADDNLKDTNLVMGIDWDAARKALKKAGG